MYILWACDHSLLTTENSHVVNQQCHDSMTGMVISQRKYDLFFHVMTSIVACTQSTMGKQMTLQWPCP